MTVVNQEVMVFPRECIQSCDRFVSWEEAEPIMTCIKENMTWLPRNRAEESQTWVQAIPCALVRGDDHAYYVLRRVQQGRKDLRACISLVVGGHIDNNLAEHSLSSLLLETLIREIDEELGTRNISDIKPLGLVVDSSSITTSRHIGFVYDVLIEGGIKPRAPEEFSTRSKFSGRLYTSRELSRFRKQFDPWSLILFADYINPSFSFDIGQQPSFSLSSKEGD